MSYVRHVSIIKVFLFVSPIYRTYLKAVTREHLDAIKKIIKIGALSITFLLSIDLLKFYIVFFLFVLD